MYLNFFELFQKKKKKLLGASAKKFAPIHLNSYFEMKYSMS